MKIREDEIDPFIIFVSVLHPISVVVVVDIIILFLRPSDGAIGTRIQRTLDSRRRSASPGAEIDKRVFGEGRIELGA